ncbi:MAG TPA: hypothetical protein VLC06_02800 [Polyangia bacterium]|nr:hypothetical protein [Polyangia bacterium]
MFVQPLLQGAESLRAAGEEDVAEALEIGAQVMKSGRRIVGESRVLSLGCDSVERPDASHEVFVGQSLVPEVVPDEAQRAANAELETSIAASKLTDRGQLTAAIIVVCTGVREAGGAKHVGQLRHASIEHLA